MIKADLINAKANDLGWKTVRIDFSQDSMLMWVDCLPSRCFVRRQSLLPPFLGRLLTWEKTHLDLAKVGVQSIQRSGIELPVAAGIRRVWSIAS
jgi:hypothetical protein